MAIDASIYGQIQAPKLESPLNALAQVTQVKNAQNQNRLFDMKVAESERARADDDAVRAAYALDDPVARANALRNASPKAYREEQTFQTTQQKAAREAEKERLLAGKAQIDLIGQVAGAARDQQSYTAGRTALQQAGIDVSGIPEQYDPAYVTQARNQALTASQQIEQVWKQKGYDLDVAKFGETVRNNKTNNGIAGANLGLRRQEVGLKSEEVRGGGKAPSGYRYKQDGSGALEAIPGGPGEIGKAPTEFQGKSATFGARAEQSDKIISELDGKYWPTALNAKQAMGAIGLESPANWFLSPEGQKAEQAQRDFINAVLRQESGAAIAESEFNNAKKQYFPQPNDSKEVRAQKSQNRKTAIEGFKRNAGKAAYTATTASPGSNIDSLLDKYK